MSTVAALRLSLWLDDQPGNFNAQDIADLEELLKEREDDTEIVSRVVDASRGCHSSKELTAALADLYWQFYGRLWLKE